MCTDPPHLSQVRLLNCFPFPSMGLNLDLFLPFAYWFCVETGFSGVSELIEGRFVHIFSPSAGGFLWRTQHLMSCRDGCWGPAFDVIFKTSEAVTIITFFINYNNFGSAWHQSKLSMRSGTCSINTNRDIYNSYSYIYIKL